MAKQKALGKGAVGVGIPDPKSIPHSVPTGHTRKASDTGRTSNLASSATAPDDEGDDEEEDAAGATASS